MNSLFRASGKIVTGIEMAMLLLKPIEGIKSLWNLAMSPLLSIGRKVAGRFFETIVLSDSNYTQLVMKTFLFDHKHWQMRFFDYKVLMEDYWTIALGTSLHYVEGHYILVRGERDSYVKEMRTVPLFTYTITARKGFDVVRYLGRFMPERTSGWSIRKHGLHDTGCEFSFPSAMRYLKSTFIEKEIEEEVYARLDHFYGATEKPKREKLGQPHRLVFLFCGVPGTGKTRFAIDLACKYGKLIHVLPVGSDLTKSEFFRTIEKGGSDNAMLLFDEIEKGVITSEDALAKLCVTLDGENAPNNAVIFLIANKIDTLPECLTRARRVHCIVKFEEFSSDLLAKAFNYWAETMEVSERIAAEPLKRFHKKFVGAKVISILDDLVREKKLCCSEYLAALERTK